MILKNQKSKKDIPKPDHKPQKPRKQKTEKVVNINSDNYIKPPKNIGKKIARVLLWGMIIFISIRGIVAIAKPDPLNEVQRKTDTFIREQQDRENLGFELQSFAQNFVKEYLSYESGRIDDYSRRVAPYTSTHVNFSGIQNFKNTATASYVQAYHMEQYDKNQYDIYVLATVEYDVPQPAKEGEDAASGSVKIEKSDTYLKVPVRVLEPGKYIVEDFPVFTAAPIAWSYKPVQFEGSEVDKSISTAIEGVLNNFYTAYYQENQTRIDYFLDPEADKYLFKGLNGRYKFIKINNLKCSEDPQNSNKILSLTELTVEDRNGQQLIQRFNVLLRRDGDRYYIAQMDTKTVDLKYNFRVQ